MVVFIVKTCNKQTLYKYRLKLMKTKSYFSGLFNQLMVLIGKHRKGMLNGRIYSNQSDEEHDSLKEPVLTLCIDKPSGFLWASLPLNFIFM